MTSMLQVPVRQQKVLPVMQAVNGFRLTEKDSFQVLLMRFPVQAFLQEKRLKPDIPVKVKP